jgi:hypothetical protein
MTAPHRHALTAVSALVTAARAVTEKRNPAALSAPAAIPSRTREPRQCQELPTHSYNSHRRAPCPKLPTVPWHPAATSPQRHHTSSPTSETGNTMNTEPLAATLAAAAVFTFPSSRAARRLSALFPKPRRPSRPWLPAAMALATATTVAAAGAPVLAVPAAAAAWWFSHRLTKPKTPATDPFRLAVTWELFAAALRAGLPVPVAIHAVVHDLPGPPGTALRATADLLALGADPVQAWDPALTCPATAPLARAARRSARSGTALAGAATALADEVRAETGAAAEARAQRAAVLISGPLTLCFLPAFVCLGIVPVVAGLAAGIHL